MIIIILIIMTRLVINYFEIQFRLSLKYINAMKCVNSEGVSFCKANLNVINLPFENIFRLH